MIPPEVFDFLYAWIAVVSWLFVIGYSTRRFYLSAAGWNYWLFSLAMAIMFSLLLWGGRDASWWLSVWLGGFITLALAATHRLALLVYDIFRDRRRT